MTGEKRKHRSALRALKNCENTISLYPVKDCMVCIPAAFYCVFLEYFDVSKQQTIQRVYVKLLFRKWFLLRLHSLFPFIPLRTNFRLITKKRFYFTNRKNCPASGVPTGLPSQRTDVHPFKRGLQQMYSCPTTQPRSEAAHHVSP